VSSLYTVLCINSNINRDITLPYVKYHWLLQDLTRQHSLPSAGLTKSRSQTMLQSTAAAPESKDLTPLVKSLIVCLLPEPSHTVPLY